MSDEETNDDLGRWVRIVNKAHGYAGVFNSENSDDKQIVEISTIEEWRKSVLAEFGIEMATPRPNPQDPPDFFVSIADRELKTLIKKLHLTNDEVQHDLIGDGLGPGNVLSIELESDQLTEVVTGFGEKSVSSEKVARIASKRAREYISSGVPVGLHLADQLLIPLALAGEGAFRTGVLTRHTKTNMQVIESFMGCTFGVNEVDPGRTVISLTAP